MASPMSNPARRPFRRLKSLHKLTKSLDTCAACGKLDDAKKLMACSGCRKVGRRVLYCSRECQKQDYKNGQPPHKEICSKSLREVPFDFASDSASATSDPFSLYTSTPSTALLLQMHYLRREHFAWDYNLSMSDGKVLYKSFDNEWKRIFLTARKNAMEKQDLGSIGVMELMLKGSLRKDNCESVDVTTQLQNEYEVKMEDCRAAAEANGP